MTIENLTSSDFEVKTRTPKILLWDLESSPIVGTTWKTYDTSLVWIEREWHLLSFSAKWLGGKQITKALPDYEGYETNAHDDTALVTELHALLEQADVLVAHNGDRFDQKKVNARFIFHGLKPPRPKASVDTCKAAKRYFAFTSNRLDALGEYLKVGRKAKTGGFELWKQCLSGDPKAWSRMRKYNAQDVRLLEAVYLKLRPWMLNHPSMVLLRDDTFGCRNCGSRQVKKNGTKLTTSGKRQMYTCTSCGSWMTGKHQGILDIR